MPFITPSAIIIRRDQRQRGRTTTDKPIDTSDLEASISSIGQIQPIIVRQDGSDLILVAGERRLLTCLKLGIDVEYKLWSDLSADEAYLVELEENVKRQDLPWREHVMAIGELHRRWTQGQDNWTSSDTARRTGYASRTSVDEILFVHKNLTSPLLAEAQGLSNAVSILQRAADRRAAAIVEELTRSASAIFTPPPTPPSSTTTLPTPSTVASSGPQSTLSNGPASTTQLPPQPTTPPPPPPSAVLNLDFLQWAPIYSGPKFNLIHCDFPYGIRYEAFANSVSQRGELYDSAEDVYWTLLDCFCTNASRFISYSAHLVFWFSMDFYEETKKKLSSAGFWVHNRPLIWYKTDNSGIVPGQNAQYPRHIYETAFLASIGKRTLIKAIGNAYGCPVVPNALHPSMKPEPMLRHFFSGLVDETTDLFDPTCGSGAALRAAESVGARSVLGLELNPEFASTANSLTLRARLLRNASRAI